MTATSPFLGFISLLVMFLSCVVMVVGAKTLLSVFKKPKTIKTSPVKRRKTVKPPLNKGIRTIQIDPDEIDKIYVGKM